MTADKRNTSTEPSPSETAGVLPTLSTKKSWKKSKKKLALIIGLVILVIILGVFYVIGSRYVMKNVMYDNGLGGKYKMNFYSKHETKKISGDTGGTQGEKLSALQGIFAKYGREGKAPLGMTISDTVVEADPSTYQSFENCKDLPVAMTVYNKYAGKELKVCVLRADGKDVMYLVAMKEGSTVHNVTFMQDVDLTGNNQAANSGNNGQSEEHKAIGLKVYRDDVKQILASIRAEK